MSRYNYLSIIVLIVLSSCIEEPKKEGIISLVSPAGQGSSLPSLFSDGEGVWLSWVEKVGDSLNKLRYSTMESGKWREAEDIVQGSDWFVNWADFPVIVENDGNLFAHVLKKSTAGTYSYDVKLNLLPEGRKEWESDIALHTDGTPTEHGFVSALPYTDGTFFVTWLDGRNTGKQEDGTRGAMTIRSAEVSATGEIRNEAVLDDSTCDCCQTTAAITDNGPVVVYRDRSGDEIRDMSIVRQVNGEWTAPKTVYADDWKIQGCPVNGPKAAALGNNLVVAWFTAAGDKPMVKLVFSGDGGDHFDEPVTISETNTMGRVDVLLLDSETALVSWMETTDGMAGIKTVKVARSGTISEVMEIAKLDASRSSGFPQMELMGDRIYFAWTDVRDTGSVVKTVYMPTAAF